MRVGNLQVPTDLISAADSGHLVIFVGAGVPSPQTGHESTFRMMASLEHLRKHPDPLARLTLHLLNGRTPSGWVGPDIRKVIEQLIDEGADSDLLRRILDRYSELGAKDAQELHERLTQAPIS